jgi:light-regulated signal transduction histidine kinase (bacteriophytochrome)
VDDLLKLARISRTELQLERVDLSAIARLVLGELQEADPGRLVQIDVEEGVCVNGDARLLHVVLANLLGNAWKFTQKALRPAIAFGMVPHHGRRTIYVRDNGAGFDMKYAHKLFAPFQRLHKSGEFEGTGIGLATVQRAIALHGGRAWAEAEPKRGATFYFTLHPGS